MHILQLLLVFCLCERHRAFVNTLAGQTKRTSLVDRDIRLDALTERQEQFWEDVEDGLNDIETFYRERGGNIDRIRKFGMRARGEIPLESGYRDFHEPSEEHIEGLTAKPLWDTTEFSWAHALEEKSYVIQQEFEEKIMNNSNLFAGDSNLQNRVMGGGWSAIRLQRLGVWNLENCAEFPKTYELLKDLDIPLAVRGVCFARQAPGSGVKPHSDGRNFILTSHLGLKIPDGCWIEVADQRKNWEEQRLLTLDTSFVHSTENPTNGDRYVLIIDFWHPEITEAERAGLEFIYDLRNKFETGLIPVRKPTRKAANNEAPVGASIA
eukprot:CAMPEP_0197272608 /NCGR_PEP_ID=MMETSP1432-20130617/10133_1 /TAXON_ID=44447 /ORGANISM="Pseudo-nitzschia delicatissima, Strain UNC1205" /LENGTH=322 /DNA_ID=CAMNT_0042738171 /DNA_START=53 /DNA_END=1017 /DNA_ORIENTATION=+